MTTLKIWKIVCLSTLRWHYYIIYIYYIILYYIILYIIYYILYYIAGYVTRKDDELSEDEMLNVTTFYARKYGPYTDRLDRGQLNIPNDRACQWTFFSFILFNTLKDKVRRTSLSSILLKISDHHLFAMTLPNCRILSNIFIKNFCLASTPRTSKEACLKVLKLSSAS